MRRLVTGALLWLALGGAALAQDRGFATTNVNLRAGPGTAYPPVMVLGEGTPLTIFGCLQDYSWCDVAVDDIRGWVAAPYIEADYRGRRVEFYDYAPTIGVPIIAFNFNEYWPRYYAGRSWYSTYDRWGPPYRPGPYPGPRPPGPGWNNGYPHGSPGWNNGHPPGWNHGRPPGGGPGNPGWNNGRPPGGGPGNPGWNNGRPPGGGPGNPGWNNGRPPGGGPGNPGANNGRPPQQGGPQQGRPPQQGGGQQGRPPQQGGPQQGRPPQQGGGQQGRPPQQGNKPGQMGIPCIRNAPGCQM